LKKEGVEGPVLVSMSSGRRMREVDIGEKKRTYWQGGESKKSWSSDLAPQRGGEFFRLGRPEVGKDGRGTNP